MLASLFASLNTSIEYVMLMVSALVLVVLVFSWHRDAKSVIDLTDLIVDSDTGKTSLYKIGQILALLVSTWVMIHETSAGRLSEWLYLSYMIAWSGANIAKKYLDLKKPATENNYQLNNQYQPSLTKEEEDADIRSR